MAKRRLVRAKGSAEIFNIGNKAEAREVAGRTFRSSHAYREFIRAMVGIETEKDFQTLPWEEIPIASKETLYATAAAVDLMPSENASNISSYLRSSGSSNPVSGGKGFFWPQLRDTVNISMQQWKSLVVGIFELDKRKTLAIVGMGLGSWSGGDRYNLMLKSLALETRLPLTVFSPGTTYSEIVEIIARFGLLYDQILIVIVPSGIYYLEKLADQLSCPLPYHKLAFIAPGEGFHEDLRKHVSKKALPEKMKFMSNYASADAELTGLESPELAEVRALLNEHPDCADQLGFKSRSIPNLFHAFSSAGYMENIEGRIVITRWQGLPLVRYDLHDSVQFFSWRTLCSELAALTGDSTKWIANSEKPYADMIGVFGRADQCVIISGNNLYGSMLEEVLMRSALGPLTTGHFVVWSSLDDGRQVLNWQIELKRGVEPTDEEIEKYYRELMVLLSEQEPGFRADRSTFASSEPSGVKLFNFHFCAEPALSDNPRYKTGIKRRIVIPSGPL